MKKLFLIGLAALISTVTYAQTNSVIINGREQSGLEYMRGMNKPQNIEIKESSIEKDDSTGITRINMPKVKIENHKVLLLFPKYLDIVSVRESRAQEHSSLEVVSENICKKMGLKYLDHNTMANLFFSAALFDDSGDKIQFVRSVQTYGSPGSTLMSVICQRQDMN